MYFLYNYRRTDSMSLCPDEYVFVAISCSVFVKGLSTFSNADVVLMTAYGIHKTQFALSILQCLLSSSTDGGTLLKSIVK